MEYLTQASYEREIFTLVNDSGSSIQDEVTWAYSKHGTS
jgi:hypothetical protein